MTTVSNPTDREALALDVEGVDYTLAPGESFDVPARTALLLNAVDGFTVTAADQATAIAADDAPTAQPLTGDETRFTGGMHHRVDDPRANVPGTPVEVTGDTGSPLNDRAEELGGPDVPARPAAKGRRTKGQHSGQPDLEHGSVIDGEDLVVKTTPQVADAEAADFPAPPAEAIVGRPVVDADGPAAPAVQSQPDSLAGQPVDASRAPAADADYQQRTADLIDAVTALRGAALDDAMDAANLSPLQKTRDQKIAELRAKILADRGQG